MAHNWADGLARDGATRALPDVAVGEPHHSAQRSGIFFAVQGVADAPLTVVTEVGRTSVPVAWVIVPEPCPQGEMTVRAELDAFAGRPAAVEGVRGAALAPGAPDPRQRPGVEALPGVVGQVQAHTRHAPDVGHVVQVLALREQRPPGTLGLLARLPGGFLGAVVHLAARLPGGILGAVVHLQERRAVGGAASSSPPQRRRGRGQREQEDAGAAGHSGSVGQARVGPLAMET
mmetsp:Transcript_117506/g.332962  ORF Transcript_117506/g.332962 Transcript_117506/m.332962 type:complete len:232 (-) Transcript_117506:14-709(-)